MHAILATYLAYYAFYYTCKDWQKGQNFLNSQECFENPTMIQKKMALITAGYLVFDCLCYYFIVKAKGDLANQTYIHHILGSTTFYLAVYVGGLLVPFVDMTLAVEASTIFLNMRWFTFEFKI